MKSFPVIGITFAVLVAHAHSALVGEIPVTSRISDAARDNIRQKIADVGGCNANVCFAIDGSGAIPPAEFEAEKNFVLDVVSVLVDNPVELAAVQYAASVRTISGLTANDTAFNEAIVAAKQRGGLSFVVGGINACFSTLFRRTSEALKIVLIGDGNSNIGSSAAARAKLFRQFGGQVCVVEAGKANSTELQAIAGTDETVFQVDSFLDVISLELIVEALVIGMCRQ